jgi:hypothetical protein
MRIRSEIAGRSREPDGGRTATQEGNTVAVLTCTICAMFVLFAAAIQYNKKHPKFDSSVSS